MFMFYVLFFYVLYYKLKKIYFILLIGLKVSVCTVIPNILILKSWKKFFMLLHTTSNYGIFEKKSMYLHKTF